MFRQPIHLTRRWLDFPAAFLLVSALLCVAIRLNATGWTSFLYITETLVLLAVLLGLALGASRFNAFFSTILALLYGAILIPWQLGMTVEKTRSDITWMERLNNLADRLERVFYQLVSREELTDSILFLLLMSLLFWIIGILAGYSLTRHGKTWQPLIPAGLSLIVIQAYDPLVPRRIWYLATFIFFCLMYVGRMVYLHHRERWEQTHTATSPYLSFEFIRYTLYTTGVVVILAWTFPSLNSAIPVLREAFEPARQAWNNLQDEMDNVFASLKATVNVPSDYYGNNLPLGRGNRLTDEVMFTVQMRAAIPAGVRVYWRSRVYSTYTDNQWLSPPFTTVAWDPADTRLRLEKVSAQWVTTVEVTSASYFTALYSPSQPQWASRPGEIDAVSNPDGTLEIYAFQSTRTVRPGQTYQVRAAPSNATEYQLRNAGVAYPDWIVERYLQLPPTLSERTSQLAQSITAGIENPFDQVIAVTAYLREAYPYSEFVPSPPPTQDGVDWFLFDLQEGFCNYFATAEVVLLRSLGIPARLAVGFATGESTEKNRYLVRQKEAHSWPEVYFPGLGWVEFEPTPAQPVIERLEGGPANNSANPGNAAEPFRPPTPAFDDETLLPDDRLTGEGYQPGLSGLQRFLLACVALLLFLVIFRQARRSKWLRSANTLPVSLEKIFRQAGLRPPRALVRWSFLAQLPPITRAYAEINHALQRHGLTPKANSTPTERATLLAQVLPSALTPASSLVRQYELSLFSQTSPNLPAALKAAQELRSLSQKRQLDDFLFSLRHPLRRRQLRAER